MTGSGAPENATPALPEELPLEGGPDRLFAGSDWPRPFAFNAEVAGVFDDMVRRSVPLYEGVTRGAARWALGFSRPGTAVYDLGCSTGTTLGLIAPVAHPGIRLFGVDRSAAMIDRAREKLRDQPVQLICADILDVPLVRPSVVIMNYTLQFLPVAQRHGLIRRIHAALEPGGLFFLSEKVRFADPGLQEMVTALYEEFKRDQGYSRTEIERKKEALDQVLTPLTEGETRQMLEDAGFSTVESVARWNNFLSLVAVKGRDHAASV